MYDRSSAYALGQEAEKTRAESALAKIGERRTSGELQRNALMRYIYRREEAHCLDQLGELERAVAVWRELADQGSLNAFVHVGRHQLELGQRSEAEQSFRQDTEAGDDDAMQELVFLLAEDGLFDEAAQWTERIARPAESGDVYAYSRLATAMSRQTISRRPRSTSARRSTPDSSTATKISYGCTIRKVTAKGHAACTRKGSRRTRDHRAHDAGRAAW
ncbi:tetratricopeptide repeat protein [Streptomyces chartreusis]|uniref:tetratricopeptide repeat protein n=1 Tax=Streptomyces chartreusis TaxID=1969 RepID=UPI0033C630E0